MSTANEVRELGIDAYLARQQDKSLLRMMTCGSVDDGKSTLIGRMLAGTNEAPGDVIHNTAGRAQKVYRGMASPEAQQEWRGKYSSNEGVSRTVPLKGAVAGVLFEIDKGVRSGLSYSGVRSITELQTKASFIVQTSAGLLESSTHIDQ